MSYFSPYKYNMSKFSEIISLDIEQYYNIFTMLNKPKNVYKVSLAQLLKYLVDFGIGYNSVCSTEVTTYQTFNSIKYVNRHGSTSNNRPANISDLKIKLFDVLKAMIRHTVKPDKTGLNRTNSIYPKYIFTLDPSNNFSSKLFNLTNHEYVEVEDFADFAHTSSNQYVMPKYEYGYVPADSLLLCPKHKHSPHDKMYDALSYKWHAQFTTSGKVAWAGSMNGISVQRFDGLHYDSSVNPLCNINDIPANMYKEAKVEMSPSWEKPDSVLCYENEKKYPTNSVDVDGGKQLSIRYPGRRYRLFKRLD